MVFLHLHAGADGVHLSDCGAWTWGGGWLHQLGFQDFAGSTIVHGTGGWAALAGALMVGPRRGKFRRDGTTKPTPPSNIPLVTLGVFILWFGWFGFNGGSQLALGSAADVVAMSHVLVNTNLAGAAGVIAAIAMSRPLLGRVELLVGLNGAIAGLVSITAGPGLVGHHWAILVGAIGGIVCTAAMKLLEKLRVDDVVGAVPAHLFAGVWGTLAASIFGDGSIWVQLLGIVAIGVFVFILSCLVWKGLAITLGIRVSDRVEQLGQDAAGRFTERRSMASCWRRATFSRASSRRTLKAETRARTNDEIMPAWCRQTGD